MMLSVFIKRLCPLMTVALAFGCGKKINDPVTADTNRTTLGQTQEMPPKLTLQINVLVSNFSLFKLPRNAWFILPPKLIATEGSAVGKRVKIYYNLLSSGRYEFHCFYKSTTSASVLSFENCESRDGVEIISSAADLDGMDFPMDKDAAIKMQLTTASSPGLKIESTYLVDWK